MLKQATTLAVAARLGACASLPDVTYTYYLAKSNTVASVTRTVTCTDKDKGTYKVSYDEPKVTPTYLADYSRPESVTLSGLNNGFADNSFNLSLAADGRLTGIGSSSTGQGGKVVQSLISLGTTVAALGAGSSAGSGAASFTTAEAKKPTVKKPKTEKEMTVCEYIAAKSNGGTALSFLYTNAQKPAELGGDLTGTNGTSDLIIPDGSNANTMADMLSDKGVPMLPIQIVASNQRQGLPSGEDMVKVNGVDSYKTKLTLQKVAHVDYIVQTGGVVLSVGSIVIPRTDGTNDTYEVPVTSAKLFGGTTFKLTMDTNGTGAPTEIDYGDTQGADQAVGAVTNIITAASPSASSSSTGSTSGTTTTPP